MTTDICHPGCHRRPDLVKAFTSHWDPVGVHLPEGCPPRRESAGVVNDGTRHNELGANQLRVGRSPEDRVSEELPQGMAREGEIVSKVG